MQLTKTNTQLSTHGRTLEAFNECFEESKAVRSFDDIWKQQEYLPKIGRIVKNNGIEEAIKAVYRLIAPMNAMFSDSSKLSPDHMYLVSEMIVETFPNFLISEVALVWKHAIKGKFGDDSKAYGKLDVPKVMNWFSIYQKHRVFHIERKREIERSIQRRDRSEMNPESYIKFLKMMEDSGKKLAPPKPVEKKKRPKYLTIEQYAIANNLDTKVVMQHINEQIEKWLEDAEGDADHWRIYKIANIVEQLNFGVTIENLKI